MRSYGWHRYRGGARVPCQHNFLLRYTINLAQVMLHLTLYVEQ